MLPSVATQAVTAELPAGEPGPGVSRALAVWRNAHYRDVRYALQLELRAPFDHVSGHARIDVTLGTEPVDVVLDWRPDGDEHDLRGLRVNGETIEPIPYVAEHVLIPRDRLKPGANRIEVALRSPVRTAGAALTRYRDGADGSEYVYSLHVPADASTLFPCFDQPDLKARFALELAVPAHWRAVSNGRQMQRTEEAQTARYRFAATEPISSYLFAFAAGPFADLQDPHSDLRLLVRGSQLERAKAEAAEVFRLQREGLRWLEGYFGRPYPYGKLDVVLVPELAYAGMEHAGAIFLREDSVLFPFEPSDADRLRRAQLIFHEASHQWFGNLVTMRWFDDLWLKEGFANLMAAKAAAALLSERDAWNAFRALKTAAYRTDETRGTTPIWQELPNLNAAKSAYGSIVYSKAPAILRQLEYYLGADAFAAGVRDFLDRYAHGAADWADLVAAFENASGTSLRAWAQAWVAGAGVPVLHLSFEPDAEGRLARAVLRQSEPPRPMRVEVLLAYSDGTARVHDVRLHEGGTVEIGLASGGQPPLYAYANHRDFGYGLFLLDARSRRYLLDRLGEVQDDLLRALLWDGLWEAVRTIDLHPAEWIASALRHLPREHDDLTTAGALARLQTAYRWYLGEAQRQALREPIEAALRAGMLEAPSRSLRIHYFRAFSALAQSPTGRATLRQLLSGELKVPDVRLSASDRYRILRRLLTVGEPQAEALLAAEAQRDRSDDARRFAYAAGAARADAATKRRYFEAFLNDPDLPERWIEEALPAFNAVEHAPLTREHLPAALRALPQLKARHKIFFLNAWLTAFAGGQVDADALSLFEQAAADPSVAPDVRRKLLEVTDELARAVSIRRAAAPEAPNP
jgi:aminopeptidase N